MSLAGNVLKKYNEATVISLNVELSDISNFKKLPKELQKEMKDSHNLTRLGHQEIVGHKKDKRTLNFSVGGGWHNNKFEVRNYGSKQYQWSEDKGLRLTKDKNKMGEAKIDPKHKKIFQSYVKEIATNLLKDYPDASYKKLEYTIRGVIMAMGYSKDNPNFKNSKKYLPKDYDATLVSNGDGNSYDSVWLSMTDNQRNTIIKKGLSGIKLSEQLNDLITESEAEKLVDNYFDTYKGLKEFMSEGELTFDMALRIGDRLSGKLDSKRIKMQVRKSKKADFEIVNIANDEVLAYAGEDNTFGKTKTAKLGNGYRRMKDMLLEGLDKPTHASQALQRFNESNDYKQAIKNIKELEIGQSEAQFSKHEGKKFKSIKDFSKFLVGMPKPDAGYDKVSVIVRFKNGEEFRGFRYDHGQKDSEFENQLTATFKHDDRVSKGI